MYCNIWPLCGTNSLHFQLYPAVMKMLARNSLTLLFQAPQQYDKMTTVSPNTVIHISTVVYMVLGVLYRNVFLWIYRLISFWCPILPHHQFTLWLPHFAHTYRHLHFKVGYACFFSISTHGVRFAANVPGDRGPHGDPSWGALPGAGACAPASCQPGWGPGTETGEVSLSLYRYMTCTVVTFKTRSHSYDGTGQGHTNVMSMGRKL